MQFKVGLPNLFCDFLKIICFCRILVYIFAYMVAAKDKKVISIRPEKGSSLREDLMLLAEKKKWSLNLYVTEVLKDHVKSNKKK